MKTVFVTGATGFIGRALCLRLRRDGFRVLAWVRSPEAALELLGPEVELVPASGGDEALVDAMEQADAVIGLAGAPVLGKRWTKKRREELVSSRVGLTERLVSAMGRASRPPSVFVSASAIGFYADSGDQELCEETPVGDSFLARLCADWEAAARGAETHGARVLSLRIGVVLGRGGGVLAAAPVFRLGLGGRLGSGRQYMPWVHLHDVIEVFTVALEDERYRGVANLSAPHPVTNATFTKELGRAVGRPTIFPVPSFLLRLGLGAAADVVLQSQRVLPRQLERWGYRFRFPDIGTAMQEVLEESAVTIRRFGADDPKPLESSFGYMKKRRPTHLLTTRTKIDRPLEQVFRFFSEPRNLSSITPPDMGFQILSLPDVVETGSIIKYRVSLGPIPMRWVTRIERWDTGARFVDSQIGGPYRAWWHEHHFDRSADGETTIMEDRVYYTPPFGWLGRIAHWVMIKAQLQRIFGYRSETIHLRFGSAGSGHEG